MYSKDKNQRVTLRLSEDQFAFVQSQVEILGCTPSEYIRMLVNSMMFTQNTIKNNLDGRKVEGRENDKTNINNLI